MTVEQTLSLPWLLLATPQLDDPNFHKAVVLVVEHDKNGSMGFIVNQPSPTPLQQIIDMPPDHSTTIPAALPSWYGGPVGRASGIILHNQQQLGLATMARATNQQDDAAIFRMNDRMFLTADQATLTALIAHESQRLNQTLPASPENLVHSFRFIVGYSGWGEGQLEEEMRQGAWIQAPMSEKVLFATSWNKMWDAAMATVGVKPVNLAPTTQVYLN